MSASSWFSLVVFLAVVAATSVTGASFRPGAWYAALAKPSWTPPNWVFPVVWTVLYVMIAVAGWLVYEREGFSAALVVWIVALILNGLWSYLMFGQREIGLAAADLTALWIAVLVFIVLAWPDNRTASLLFVPYLAWISYAGALNFAILRMNAHA